MKLLSIPGMHDSLSAPYPSQALAFVDTARALDNFPHFTTRTLVGIAVAISGNILISLALNLQKLAHKRVEKEKAKETSNATTEGQYRPNIIS
jgi:hypothetical protein